MAHQADDISRIEDIGERLDALLDALETSSNEVARIGSSLDKPLSEVRAGEPASPPPAAKPPKPAAPEPPPAEAEQADPEPEPEPELEAPEATEEVEVEAESEPEIEAVAAPPAEEAPTDSEPAEDPEEATQLDDGLLIEPEFGPPPAAPAAPSDDIDGAPVGSLDLEQELDAELESLLASGMFEDPLAEMGVDESAEPIELPDEPVESVEPPPPPQRTPKPPTDEAELIGELDEQLAALADAQLAEDLEPQTAAPADAEPVEDVHPDAAPASESTPPSAEPKPAPPAKAAPVAPAAPAPTGWRGHVERVRRHGGPVARRAMERGRVAAVAGATRVSAPLKNKPQVRQVVGWVGLVQAFLAACVWAYLALWHNPPEPPAPSSQPSLEVASGG